MRTVLATDEMLAYAVRKKVPGKTEFYDRPWMRKNGDDTVRDIALASPCVLAIGASQWQPPLEQISFLERWQLPDELPVILIVDSLTNDVIERATQVNVYSIVPLDQTAPSHATYVAAECVLAWAWRLGLRPRPPRSRVVPFRHHRVESSR